LASTDPALSLRDVHTYYGDSHVIQGVDLEVPTGATVALLGRNGMGKTTLDPLDLQPDPAAPGPDRPQGAKPDGARPEPRGAHAHGAGATGAAHLPSLPVRDNLGLPTSVLAGGGPGGHWSLGRIYEMFPRLKERAGQMAGSLSGGEQSMLAFGRALMANPETILMDEPTEGLAPVIVAQIAEVVATLKASGVSILLVEQNAAFASRVADSIAILANGRIVWRGTPAQLEADDEVRRTWLGL